MHTVFITVAEPSPDRVTDAAFGVRPLALSFMGQASLHIHQGPGFVLRIKDVAKG